MPIGPTSGFLDFTNATPRADVIIALSNVGVGTDVPLHALDIRGTANVADIIINNDLTLTGGLTTNTLTINNVSMSTTSNFQQVTNVANATTNTVRFTNPTTGFTVSSNAEVGGELSVSGNVGIGTTEPTESLDIVGNLNLQKVSNTATIKLNSNVVTEYVRSKKLIKYPRVAMTAATTSGYTASASSDIGLRQAHQAFDNILYVSWHEPYYLTNPYPNADGAYTGGSGTVYDTNGYEGEYLQIQLPEKIKLYSYSISSRSGTGLAGRQPKDAKIFASNDGSTWIDIHTHNDVGETYNTNGETRTFQLDNITETYYIYYRLVVNSIIEGGTSDTPNTSQWQLYGIPEYDPEAHGTDVIMRSVPNVPNTDWLEVYYDGQDYTSMPSTVTDKSGNGVTGTPTNGVTFDSTWKAFNFDAATNQYITATTTNQAGAFVHTVSMWVKFSELTSSQHFLFRFGSTAGAAFTAIGMYYSANQGIRVSTGVDYRTRFHPTPGEWVHIMYSYSGGTLDEAASDTRVKFYVNGVRWQFQDYYQGGSVTPAALNLPGTNTLQVNGKDGASNIIVDMSVANFRLFNRALTGDEAWQLYAYQKEYFQVSPDVVTFKNGRLGIGTPEPRAVLDVKGDLDVRGIGQFGSIYAPGTIIQVRTNDDDAASTGNTSLNFTTTANASSGDIPIAQATGLKATITPRSTKSRIYVDFHVLTYFRNMTNNNGARLQVWRKIGSTYTRVYGISGKHDLHHYDAQTGSKHAYTRCTFVDNSPNTLQECEYELRAMLYTTANGGGSLQVGNTDNQPANCVLMEIGGE